MFNIINLIFLILLVFIINIKPKLDVIKHQYDNFKNRVVDSFNYTKAKLQESLNDLKLNANIIENVSSNEYTSLQRILYGKLIHQRLDEIYILDQKCESLVHVHLGITTNIRCDLLKKFLNTSVVISEYEYPKLLYVFVIKSFEAKTYYVVGIVNLNLEWLRYNLGSYDIIDTQEIYISSKLPTNKDNVLFYISEDIDNKPTVFVVSKYMFWSSVYLYVHNSFIRSVVIILEWILIIAILFIVLINWWIHVHTIRDYQLERALFLSGIFQSLKTLDTDINIRTMNNNEISFESAKKFIVDLFKSKEGHIHKLEEQISSLESSIKEQQDKFQIMQKQKQNLIKCIGDFIEQNLVIKDKELSKDHLSLLSLVLFAQNLLKAKYKDEQIQFFNHYSLESVLLQNNFPKAILLLSIYLIYKSFILELNKYPLYKTKINTQVKNEDRKISLIINLFPSFSSESFSIQPNLKFFPSAKEILSEYGISVFDIAISAELSAIVISWQNE